MPDEPTVAGYAILAIGIACYIALALIWHWAFCKSIESEDEAERRTQFCRAMQAKADREKIEEWKECREVLTMPAWDNWTAPTHHKINAEASFDLAMMEARESLDSGWNEADEWIGEAVGADYKRTHDEVIELIRNATQKERDKVSKALEQSLWSEPCHALGMNHAYGVASFPYVIPAPSFLMPGEYRNPFHFLDEFDQWFEFQSRKRFYKERTQDIIADMLKNDLDRARKSCDSSNCGLKFDVMRDFGAQIFSPRAVFINPDLT